MRLFRIRVCVIALLFVTLGSCGLWEKKLAFVGPLPEMVVEIEQPFPANGWGIRAVLKTGHSTKTLYEQRGDVFLFFADVYWDTADGGAVAVLTCGTPPLRIAYSLSRNALLPFSQFQPMMAEQIRRTYHLDQRNADEKDALEWACSTAGKDAFSRSHPDASPR